MFGGKNSSQRFQKYGLLIIACLVAAGIALLISPFYRVFFGIDWHGTFYPVTQAVLHGRSPYTEPKFQNVPWTILPLLPFGLLPENLGGAAYAVASLLIYAVAAYRLGASRIGLIAFLLSPPVIYGLRLSNVDALVLLGFTLPPAWGLLLVAIKPQMGFALAIYWLFDAWRQGGWMQALKTGAPLGIALAVSLLIFGYWPATRPLNLIDSAWNASLWPWSIPIGVVLIARSLRDGRKDFAMAASPFLSPYLAYHSWAAVLTALIKKDFDLIAACIGMWLVAVVRAVAGA